MYVYLVAELILPFKIPIEPRHKKPDYTLLLIFRKLDTARNFIPLFKTASATARRGVHCFKYRVPMHRSLPSIVIRHHRRKFLAHEILSVPSYDVYAFFIDILHIFFRQFKRTSEFRIAEFIKRLFYRLHLFTSFKVFDFYKSEVQILLCTSPIFIFE